MTLQSSSPLYRLVDRLYNGERLKKEEFILLLNEHTPDLAEYTRRLARKRCDEVYGKEIYIRGLIEISNICKNNCLYCGIRRDNTECDRYRLAPCEILECCEEGYALGFRTFVLQGGEDGYFTDDILVELIKDIKKRFPDTAITLSLGERSYESYKRLREAGADRYLLRHESADKEHYARLHPEGMSLDTRLDALKSLHSLGYQVGIGFMVGSPYQTTENIATDLEFISDFPASMCGIGPFIPHDKTPFASFPAGTLSMCTYLISIIRLIKPGLLLPSTTALGTIEEGGREAGILAGANVVMPNLSPSSVRKKYTLYNNKLTDGAESAECLNELKRRMADIGYKIVTDRGDAKI